jgi:hypothetical protein
MTYNATAVPRSICCIAIVVLGNYVINHCTTVNIQKHRVLKLTFGNMASVVVLRIYRVSKIIFTISEIYCETLRAR